MNEGEWKELIYGTTKDPTPAVQERIKTEQDARRCLKAIVAYLVRDDSPLAAEDLVESVRILVQQGPKSEMQRTPRAGSLKRENAALRLRNDELCSQAIKWRQKHDALLQEDR